MMSTRRYLFTHVFGITAALALLALAIGLSGLDMRVAHLTYDDVTLTFVGRHSYVLSLLADRVLVALPVLVGTAALTVGLCSFFRPDLTAWRGISVAVLAVIVAGPLAAIALKHVTALPRPHMLQIFGGRLALPARFFAGQGQPSGGALPSSHAAFGFTLLGLYFAGLVAGWRNFMRWGLALGVALGVSLSVLRVAQGAHFLSQTVWSAALLWLLSALIFLPLMAMRAPVAGARVQGRPRPTAIET
ncbi:phosphatase PAP2 family protein [Alcaligenaceae bacterium C4P045]|nr:phosphatase PAP2 family protein [Alcaligenaceae bacterium C4P045]